MVFFAKGPERDFYAEVASGLVDGYSIVHKFGRNTNVANGVWSFVDNLAHTVWPISAATTVRVKAGNAADTADGAGAREITVVGLDENCDVQTETIATAGESASDATTVTFLRPYRAYVSSAGTYGGSNTAAVVIENGSGGTNLIRIDAGEGQTSFCAYTIPAGYTGLVTSFRAEVDASKAADIRLRTRDNADDSSVPVSAVRTRMYFDGVKGSIDYEPIGGVAVLGAKTDVWVEAEGSGAITEVSASFSVLLRPV